MTENRKKRGASRWLSNRNIIFGIVVVFALYWALFDRDNFVQLNRVNEEIRELEREEEFYREQIKADSAVITGLSDSAYIEQYARENYYFKFADETIYIIR